MATADNREPEDERLMEQLQGAVGMAEEMALPPTERWAARRIGDDLIPALFEARTYIEVGRVAAPEIRLGLTRASLVASDLADVDPRFAPLHSRLKVLQEKANMAARER
ncbi:MAG: hypothetical protein WD208_10760 [Dehalococcoidia bacterium]